jgi:hypothetical protein
LFQRQAAGLLTYSFSLAVFPKDMVFSDIIASMKSLQQRELSGIFTRFPFDPNRPAAGSGTRCIHKVKQFFRNGK